MKASRPAVIVYMALVLVWPVAIFRAMGAEEKAASGEQTLDLTGTLEPFEKTLLYAKVSGYLKTLRVDIGDEVKEGDIIAEITVPEMAPQLTQAEAAVDAARARLDKVKADAQLATAMHKRIVNVRAKEPGAATLQDEEIARAQSKVADAQVAVMQTEVHAADAKIRELKTMMEYTIITAPYSGVITARLLDTGDLVTSGTANGKPVAEIMRQDKLRLVIYLPESAVPYVTKGHPVTIELDALAGTPMNGVIDRCSQSLAPDTRSMRAEIHLDNPNEILLPGMFAKKVTVKYSLGSK